MMTPMRHLRRFRGKSLRHIFSALLAYFEDLYFDFRNGTDTVVKVPIQNAGVNAANRVHALDYDPAHVRDVRNSFQTLKLPKQAVLVDLGSGKGRVLLLAAEYGFRKAIGVEFSKSLCDIATKNIEKYKRRNRVYSETRIHCSDVVDFAFVGDENVLFMFNPFEKPVLSAVLRNFLTSLQERPRPVWIIYHNPRHRDVLDECPALTCLDSPAGMNAAVYVNSPMPCRLSNEPVATAEG